MQKNQRNQTNAIFSEFTVNPLYDDTSIYFISTRTDVQQYYCSIVHIMHLVYSA